MQPFTALSLAAYAFVVLAAGVVRGRFYAVFAAVILGIHTSVSVALAPRFGWAGGGQQHAAGDGEGAARVHQASAGFGAPPRSASFISTMRRLGAPVSSSVSAVS